MESDKQAILQFDDIATLFPCPKEERITLPDQRNHKLAQKYREGIDQLKQKTTRTTTVRRFRLFILPTSP